LKKKKFNFARAKKVGGSGNGKMKVYISKDIYRQIFKYAKNEKENQVGGVLLGNTHSDDDSVHVIVRAFIPAMYAEINSGELTFTKETWKYIDAEKEKQSDMKIVGWMHTNPDKGCEPADYDVFFHSHFIKENDTVEYIIDPVQMAESLYYLSGEEMKKIDGFFLYPNASAAEGDEDVEESLEISNEENTSEDIKPDELEEMATEESMEEQSEEPQVKSVEDATEEVAEFKSEEIQSIFEKAEQSIEADDSDVERNFIEEQTEDEEAPKGRTSVFMKVVVSILSVLVIALVAVVILLAVKLVELEKDMDTLYKNDEVIAKYINGVEDEH